MKFEILTLHCRLTHPRVEQKFQYNSDFSRRKSTLRCVDDSFQRCGHTE